MTGFIVLPSTDIHPIIRIHLANPPLSFRPDGSLPWSPFQGGRSKVSRLQRAEWARRRSSRHLLIAGLLLGLLLLVLVGLGAG